MDGPSWFSGWCPHHHLYGLRLTVNPNNVLKAFHCFL
jgi:hypothetical protein